MWASQSPIFLDIETIPDESRRHLWDLPDAPDIYPLSAALVGSTVSEIRVFLDQFALTLPSDYLAAIEDAEQQRCRGSRKGVSRALTKARQAEADLRKTLSLDPERGRAAVGWAVGDGEVQGAAVYDRMPEQEALKLIWNILDDQAFSPIVGYNVLGFDLPVIFARSILLGVEATRAINMRKYGNPDVIDLMVARFPSGRKKSLKTLAAQYGIEVPCPDVDGGDVFGMSPEERAEYVRSDVIVTRALYQRFRGYFC